APLRRAHLPRPPGPAHGRQPARPPSRELVAPDPARTVHRTRSAGPYEFALPRGSVGTVRSGAGGGRRAGGAARWGPGEVGAGRRRPRLGWVEPAADTPRRTRSAGPSSYGAPYEIGRTVRVRAPPGLRAGRPGRGRPGVGWVAAGRGQLPSTVPSATRSGVPVSSRATSPTARTPVPKVQSPATLKEVASRRLGTPSAKRASKSPILLKNRLSRSTAGMSAACTSRPSSPRS